MNNKNVFELIRSRKSAREAVIKKSERTTKGGKIAEKRNL